MPSASLALVCVALGNPDQALDYLEKGADRRELQMGSIKVHPAYNDLRSEPRFQALLARVGFV